MSTQNIGVLCTDSLPAKVWREIARQTTNLEFRAQIREELSKHSENDTLRIRIDHIIEQPPPAPGEVTIRLKHHDAQKALDALNYGISDWVRFHGSAEDIDWMVAERDALTAALAAAAAPETK